MPTPEWLELRRKEEDLSIAPEFSRYAFSDVDDNPLVRDIAFNRHSINDGDHVSPSDNGTIQVGTDGLRVSLVQGIDVEQLKRTLTAATRATVGLDMTQSLPGSWEHCTQLELWCQSQPDSETNTVNLLAGFQEWTECDHESHKFKPIPRLCLGKVPMEDWEEMLKGGLQTALESQVIVFAVGGASRTCTHQLVRSRRAAFHQQSQRAGYMGDAPEVRMPESVWKNERARNAFFRATIAAWRAYRVACEEDISYQDARFVLQEGTTNFILLEYSVREFLNLFAYRGCYMFQWEIVDVMHKCRDILIAEYPWLEPYIKISCEKTGPAAINVGSGSATTVPHHCTFQGWEDVEGQCPFSWAKHEARTFKPAHHRISRKAE